MEIKEQVAEKDVTDYDFSFAGGIRLPLTVDVEAGDLFEEFADKYVVTIKPKPNLIDPEQPPTDEEVYNILKRNLSAYLVRKRKQKALTAEQLFDLRQFLHPVTKKVQ